MDLTKVELRAYTNFCVGNVIKIKGKYGFRVVLSFEDLSEKTCQHSGFLKEADATKARDEIIAQLHEKKYVIYKNIKLEEWLIYWLEYVMRPKPDFRANSYQTYKNCIYKHINPRIGKLKLMTLNQGHIIKLLKELGEKYTSIPKIAKPILNTSLEYAKSKNLILKNPCEDIPLKIGDKQERHVQVIDEKKTLTLEQVKLLLAAGKKTRIYMQLVFALLMGLRRGEINGLKYSDIDYENRILKLDRQLGEDLHADESKILPKTKTKQEVPLKTKSSYRDQEIPDYVYYAILEERKKYEKNRSRRQHGRWVFQDLDYICCSSYGRPRSKNYHFVYYKELLSKLNLPNIRFHDLRSTYTTLLMKNDVNQKAIAKALGHANAIVTMDVYTNKKEIIKDGVEGIETFIAEVHPFD